MANLQIKGIKDDFYAQIKALADSENRSISQQVLFLLKEHISRRSALQKSRTPAQVLLALSGSWEDDRDAEQIIAGIRKSRKNSKKLSKGL